MVHVRFHFTYITICVADSCLSVYFYILNDVESWNDESVRINLWVK